MEGSVSGRSVLVTGAGGFIGSTLVERLVREGARVRAFVRYNSLGHRGWIESFEPDVAASVEVFAGDLKDPESVRRAADGCEIVYHLGALIAIPYSYQNPLDFVQTNVLGTAHVLDACRQIGVERMIHTSTSEVYGTARSVPIDEEHPLSAQSPYAASKLAADALVQSYCRAFELPVAVLRPFNTFGPRQSARSVIPTIALQALAERDVELGSLRPTRDFVYVDDTVDAYLRIARAEGVVGEVVHLGSGREISIGDLAEAVIERTGSGSKVVCDRNRLRPTASEVQRLCADPSKARKLLGWEPRVGLREGLDRTIDWLERNMSGRRLGEYRI